MQRKRSSIQKGIGRKITALFFYSHSEYFGIVLIRVGPRIYTVIFWQVTNIFNADFFTDKVVLGRLWSPHKNYLELLFSRGYFCAESGRCT